MITPNHFLRAGNTFPNIVISEERASHEVYSDARETLLKSLELIDIMLGKFKSEWYHYNLLTLRETHRKSWENPINNNCNKWLTVGSAVLIKNLVKPRAFWSLGRISELLVGGDNKVRVVKVSNADSYETVISIANIYPLELDAGMEDISVNNDVDSVHEFEVEGNLSDTTEGSVCEGESSTSSSRPFRQAAENHKLKFKQWMSQVKGLFNYVKMF